MGDGRNNSNPLGALGGVVGGFIGDITRPIGQGLGLIPDSGPMEDLQRRYEQNMQMMQQYRPNIANAQAQGLRHQLGAYGPTNSMLGKMYGPQAMLDLQNMGNIDPVLSNLLQPLQPPQPTPSQLPGPQPGATVENLLLRGGFSPEELQALANRSQGAGMPPGG